MSSTDDRIVKMQFDNAQFKKGAVETQKALSDVNKAVDASGKSKGLLDLASGMQRVGVTASKMAIVTTTALATIANKVTNTALSLTNSLTFAPLKSGFSEYESLLTKQNVIMNATGKSAKEVKTVLNELNKYSDKTIYNFGNMTDSLQKFVNAGVPLDTAVVSIKGIANAAAFAGASAEEANRGMYAFSQAMQTGHIMLQDWMQIENANMGTIAFKTELIKAGEAAGTLTKKGDHWVTKSGKYVSATKGWRDGLQEQWATTEVLNKTLGKYADRQTDLGKKAFKSAQDVRTFTAFMDTLKESLASGWSSIFTSLIGGLDESTKMWTGLSNTVGENVHKFFEWAAATVRVFERLGGIQNVLQGFKNILAPFVALAKAIGEAWNLAFPEKGPGSGKTMAKMAEGFEFITRPLASLAEVIPKIVPYLADVFKFIKSLGSGIGNVSEDLGELVGWLKDLVDLDAPSAEGFGNFLGSIVEFVAKLYEGGIEAAKNFFQGIVDGFSNGSFDTAATIVSAGLLGAIFVAIRKIMKNGLSVDIGSGLLSNISEGFSALTGSLTALQNQLKSKTLMNLAIAIGLLTASLIALSFLSVDDLKKSLATIAVGFTQLLIAMAILDKIGSATGFIKLPFIAAGMVLLAGSILLLTGAIAAMSLLSWEQIGKGLAGVGGALVVIAAGMQLMPKTLPITGAGLVLVGVGLTAISGAMHVMSLLSWEDIGKGLVSTAGSLAVIALAMNLMPKTLPITAAGLVLVGVALTAISGALKIMGTMSWDEIGRGLTVLAGAMIVLAGGLTVMQGSLLGAAALVVAAGAIDVLVPALLLMSKLTWKEIGKGLAALAGGLIIIAGALYLMSGALAGAAALLIITPALLALSTVLVVLGNLGWEKVGMGLAALAAGLAVIGIAGLLIGPVVPALLGLGAALLLLGAGLALAGAGILAFATGLGLLVALGAGAVAMIGKYIGAFIEVLPELGEAVGQFIIEMIEAISKQTPIIIDAIVGMLTGLLSAAKKLLPKLAEFFGAALRTVIGVIKDAVPRIVTAGIDVVLALIRGVTSRIDEIVDAAVDLIIAFANGLKNNSIKILNAGVDLIASFLHDLATTIRSGSGKIGSGLLDVIDAFKDVGINLVKGLISGITSMAGDALDAVGDLAGDLAGAAMDKLKIWSPSRVFMGIGRFLVMGLTQGIQNHAASAISAVASMVGGQIAVANEYVSGFIQKLDQQAIAARAKADGLASAAEKAAKAADKTKGKSDDRAANRIGKQAEKADKAAEEAEKKAERAKEAQDRKEEFQNASTLEKAQMRSEDAQKQLDAAKAAEARAAKNLAEADALEKQSKVEGVTAKQRRQMQKEADELREQAKKDAKNANQHLKAAKGAAADALAYQKKAGDEAAAAFQEAFDTDAKAAAEDAAFEKLSDAEKAEVRRKQAEQLQIQAAADLAEAKKLAFKDLDAANDLAALALAEAEQARRYLEEAEGYSGARGGISSDVAGRVVNMDPTDAAAIAMSDYDSLYSAAAAAAAGSRSVEFNQYNTSPEPLSPSEVYRQTNNIFTYAVEKLDEVAAAA